MPNSIEEGDSSKSTNDVHRQTTTTTMMKMIRGRIDRKRKYHGHVSLALRTSDDDTNNNKYPPELIMVEKNSSNPLLALPLEACFVGAVIEAKVKVETTTDNTVTDHSSSTHTTTHITTSMPTRSNNKNNNHKTAIELTIVRSSPDPNAIQACLKLVAERRLPMDIFSHPTTNRPLLFDATQASDILQLDPKDSLRRGFVKHLARGLKGELLQQDDTTSFSSLEVGPRRRPSHIKRRHRELLVRMEESQSPLQNVLSETSTNSPLVSSSSSPMRVSTEFHNPSVSGSNNNANAVQQLPIEATYNLPDPENPKLKSGRHPKTRREYLHDKKWPQIQWLLRRLVPIVETLRQRSNNQQLLEILDVGGGRGDIAVAIAEAFENVRVTVVDINESSLQGGRAYYQSRKQFLSQTGDSNEQQEDRVRFVCGDFADYGRSGLEGHQPQPHEQQQQQRQLFDVVIAWHACGDLSDYALEYSVQHNNANAFVICPCCYTKRHIPGFRPTWNKDYCTPVVVLPSSKTQTDEKKSQDETTTTEQEQRDRDEENRRDQEIAIIQRLAEINERPEITHRAMKLINTMRLRSLLALSSTRSTTTTNDIDDTSSAFSITLEEYDVSHSSKNLVLVGIRK